MRISYFLYLIIAIILLFGFFELLTRFYFPEIQPYGTDKQLIKEHVFGASPGLKPLSEGISQGILFQVDTYGFRRFKTPVDTSKDAMLLLGDSVTMGLGVEADSTFAGILHNQSTYNILNPSLFGYTVNDYLNIIQQFLVDSVSPFHIKKVIMAFCLNDIYTTNSIKMPGSSLRDVLGDFLLFIKAKSRFYLLLKKVFFDRPKSYYIYDQQFYKANNPLYQKTVSIISDIHQICQVNNIDFVVLILPYEYQLRQADLTSLMPQNLLVNSLDKKGIKAYNPIPFLLQKRYDSKKLFLFGDGIHFSILGHQLIAQYLAKTIRQSSQ